MTDRICNYCGKKGAKVYGTYWYDIACGPCREKDMMTPYKNNPFLKFIKDEEE